MYQRAYTITDLGYGDAGKGTTVDFLTRHCNGALIIRHNGGAQAAHNVVTVDGQHHTFAQFGSGMFHPTAATYLSRYMIIDPLAMRAEAQHLDALGVADVRRRTVIDPAALVATPFHAIVNRIRERARDQKHGSCGLGIGETAADSLAGCALYAADLAKAGAVLPTIRACQLCKLQEIGDQYGDWQDYATLSEIAVLTSDTALDALCAHYAVFAHEYQIADRLTEFLDTAQTVIFEGAQGVLLDEWYGFHPYTTWSTTTDSNALVLLTESGFGGDVTRLGVVRTYMTRHGNGPFVTESPHLTRTCVEAHNDRGEFQGAFRCGEFDAVALRYALSVNQDVDALVVTHCDIPQERWHYCDTYQWEGNRPVMCFTGHGREITDIQVKVQREDLHYQERLTHSLGQCRPVIRACDLPTSDAAPGAVCAAISDLLAVPVALASWGATAGQKTVLNSTTLLKSESLLAGIDTR